MDKDVAREIFSSCESAIVALDRIGTAIERIPDDGERSAMRQGLARTMSALCGSLRGPVVASFPDIELVEDYGEPDTLLDADELSYVSGLSDEDLSVIDAALMAECAAGWRKVARVVGGAMMHLGGQFEALPDGFCAQRIIALVEAGCLHSQGDLNFMRHSEVRLP